MRGEVHDSVLAKIRTQHDIAAGVEVECLKNAISRSEPCDLLSLVAAEAKPHKFLHTHIRLRAVGPIGGAGGRAWRDGVPFLRESGVIGAKDWVGKNSQSPFRHLPSRSLFSQNRYYRRRRGSNDLMV